MKPLSRACRLILGERSGVLPTAHGYSQEVPDSLMNVAALWTKHCIAPGRCAVAVVMLVLAACTGSPAQMPGKPDHHRDDGGFRNPPGSPSAQATLGELASFFWRRIREQPPAVPSGHVIPHDDALAAFDASAGDDTVTWLGHASFLLRVTGKTILTDPYLGEVAGPFGFGPSRYAPPGLLLADLPPIDIVLVSHNHYDHLDATTIAALPGKDRIQVIVPLGLGDFFRERGYRHVHERDWYERVAVDPIEIEVLPAIHFSRRGLFDRNRTLWSGFAIRSDGISIFHSGDTAYGPVFREIGRRAGPFDVALVAIGAYEPRSIMQVAHVTPEEAVSLVDDIGARSAIGMHWGTIELTDEPPFEPPVRFRAAAHARGWPEGRARVMRIGETLRLAALRFEESDQRNRPLGADEQAAQSSD